MIVVGEVHSGLLHHSYGLSADRTRSLLDLAPGEQVRQSHRPMARTESPPLLTGVDCDLPLGKRTGRGIGTVLARAVITGGHVLQGSSFAHITVATEPRRLSWPHYLSRPGTIESITAPPGDGLIAGLLAETTPQADQLRLTGISDRTMNLVQRHGDLDHRPPFRAPRTRMSWVADIREDAVPGLHLTVKNPTERTLLIRQPGATLEAVTTLCEDIAYHDWLLSTVIDMVSRAHIGGTERTEAVSRLEPIVDHLLHLWMPAAHCDEAMAQRWQNLEKAPGFSRQWTALVNRVRDQLTLATLAATGPAPPRI